MKVKDEDVVPGSTYAPNYPLLTLESIIITPHLSPTIEIDTIHQKKIFTREQH